MSSKSIKTFSAILVVLVLATISCEFSFGHGKKTATPSVEVQQVTSAPVEPVVQPTTRPTEAIAAFPTDSRCGSNGSAN